MNWFYKLRMAYKILLPVSLTLVCVLSILAWQIQSKGSEIVQRVAERELIALAGNYSTEVHSFIDIALQGAIDTANNLSYLEKSSGNTALSREQIIILLENMRVAKQLVGVGLASLPMPGDENYANTPGSDANGQFYPYATSSGVALLDKNEFNAPYFTVPQETKKPYISEPYIYKIDGKDILMMTASAPVIVENVFKGVVFLDFELSRLAKMASEIQVYSTGGISVLTQNNTFLAHRDPKLVLKNIFELDRWRNNLDLKKAIQGAQTYLHTEFVDGVESFFYFHPFKFPQTGQIMYFIMIVPVEEVMADVAQLTNITVIASICALIILLLIIFLGVRSSVKPLAILAVLADDVAKGKFDVSIDTRTFGGEILALYNSLKTMLDALVQNINRAEAMSKDAQGQSLKAQEAMRETEVARVIAENTKQKILEIAKQLENAVIVITTASQQLSTQIEQSEQASIMQAERVTETATAMEEMNCTVSEVAQSASSASEISSQTRAHAETGTSIVREAVAGIEAVQTVSLTLKEDMNILANEANAISKIMNVISDIADQTNLLALNAAIEAARAGDAGRGFAVVADEVRKLAEKTMSSTTEVGNAIKAIQSSVDISIKQVDKAVDLIGVATEQSNQSGKSLNEIMELVDTTADQVRAIATASEQQSATSNEINRAILEINDLSNQSAQRMREATTDINDLALQAQALGTLIEEMKQA